MEILEYSGIIIAIMKMINTTPRMIIIVGWMFVVILRIAVSAFIFDKSANVLNENDKFPDISPVDTIDNSNSLRNECVLSAF